MVPLIRRSTRSGASFSNAANKLSGRERYDPTIATLPIMLVNPKSKFRDVFGLMCILCVYMGFRAFQDVTAPLETQSAVTKRPPDDDTVVQEAYRRVHGELGWERRVGVPLNLPAYLALSGFRPAVLPEIEHLMILAPTSRLCIQRLLMTAYQRLLMIASSCDRCFRMGDLFAWMGAFEHNSTHYSICFP